MVQALIAAAGLLGAGSPLADAAEVFARGPGGAWRTIQGSRTNGSLTIRVSPEDTEAGRVVLVVGKPDWMMLEDTAPPYLKSASADDHAIPAGDRLEVQTDDRGPWLTAIFEDDGNPVQPESLALVLDGQSFPPSDVEAGPPGKTASATFDLSALGPGMYDGFLEARDLAPAGNALRLPARVAVNGIRRQDDGQTVTICRDGHKYVVGGPGQGQAFVRLGTAGTSAYLSTEVGGRFVYARNVVRLEDLTAKQGARLVTDVIGIDGQDFGQIAELEFDLAVIPQFPGLLVTSRARNLDREGDVYCFWGWLPGSGYVAPDGAHTWAMKYAEIGSVGWVFLPPREPDQPGIGIISALPFGESRFGTLLIYTDPKRVRTEPGGTVEMRLAFMLADGPGPVAEAYTDLSETGWLAAE
jgi:hypothetical protein